MASLNKALWLKAALDVMIAVTRMATLDFISDIPYGRRPLPTKWVWTTKKRMDNKIEKFKVRWVACEDHQKKGLDYNNTFAPVASLTILRIVLTIATQLGLSIDQMDIVSAFLNGQINTTVNLTQPEGFSFSIGMVCILHKSIYGLCQAARIWYNVLHDALVEIGFNRLVADLAC